MTKRKNDLERTHLFVVRLWPESFDQDRRAWRGEVVDTGTDIRHYFARWEDFLEFLCEAIGVPWEGAVSREITMEVMRDEPEQERNKRID